MERRNKEWNQLIETTKTIIKITLYQELEETLNGNMLSQLITCYRDEANENYKWTIINLFLKIKFHSGIEE